MDRERDFLEEFTSAIGTRMIHFVPRDNIVQKAEFNKKTVTEFDAEEQQAKEYSDLAGKIINNDNFVIPKPLSMDELESMVVKLIKYKAFSGSFGDGKIFVTPVDGVITVRTGSTEL